MVKLYVQPSLAGVKGFILERLENIRKKYLGYGSLQLWMLAI